MVRYPLYRIVRIPELREIPVHNAFKLGLRHFILAEPKSVWKLNHLNAYSVEKVDCFFYARTGRTATRCERQDRRKND